MQSAGEGTAVRAAGSSGPPSAELQGTSLPPVDGIGEPAAPTVVADAGVAVLSRQGLSSMLSPEADTAEAMPAAQPVTVLKTAQRGDDNEQVREGRVRLLLLSCRCMLQACTFLLNSLEICTFPGLS